MKKLEYSIDIQSTQEEVWHKMLDPENYIEWTNVSWPGSFYSGKWQQGEDIRFIGKDGSGTLARIKKLVPYETVKADHIAVLHPGGIEDKDSDVAKGWIGTEETYIFTSNGNATKLKVEILTNPDWEQMFNDGWPAALAKLKEMCESKN